ncbi:site-specific integrase [Dysgonomonas sp. ZJ709]|uniref:site-specific integrase n=1 Tax=Dysgonomonas sp. ZJ709 TaxID=2709797 RepID=UPI0013E9B2AA|nr:site-specific integrase [Dysgonomonas sp. ZJ709]
MKVTFIIKKTVKRYDTDSKATIYLRLRDGRRLDSIAPTELTINPNLWDDKAEQVKSKVVCSDELRNEINGGVRLLKTYIEKEYQTISNDEISKDWLKTALDKYHNPNKYKTKEELIVETKPTIEELLDEFLLKHKLSEVRRKNFRVVRRAILRYELYVKATRRGQKDFVLDIDNITSDTLRDMWDFFENEHKYFELYPAIYESIPEKRTPKPRGKNTLNDCFCRIRTFFLWCFDNKKTTNRPFDQFRIDECTYGTPIYITLEERDKLFEKDLSVHKQVEIQRDIFVFQSLIGCRIGDLYRMTKQNIINDAIEYIPRKTKEGNPLTVRVPLNDKAKLILEKYKDCESNKLLPFISEQKYNDAIKKAFELAEINRIVTILDPLTNEEVKKPMYEVASSHMARRTFIGNIYKKVKDPNLIGALSGHKEGSKAFSRYREIDEDMKKELVNLLG